MVDGVSFNPFTGKDFTIDEINHLDTDKNGKISAEELTAGMSWLKSQDTDADAEIKDTNTQISEGAQKLFTGAKSKGAADTASNQTELNEYMEIVQDEYLEQYFQANLGLSKEEKATIIALVQSSMASFLKEVTASNAKGPYDIKSLTNEFSAKIEKTFAESKELLETTNKKIDDYKNTDGRFDDLMGKVKTASADYVTGTEYREILQDSVKYLLGELMNGNNDSELFGAINPKYASNANYKKALESIKTLQNTTDPAQMADALAKAEAAVTEFVRAIGKDNLVDAVSEARSSKAESLVTEGLQSFADEIIAQAIAQENATRVALNWEYTEMSDQEIDQLKDFVNNCMSKYIAELAEKNGGDLSDINVNNLGSDFSTYVNAKMQQLVQTQERLAVLASDSTAAFDTLQALTKHSNSDGYITENEKSMLVNSARDFIISQMLNGVENNSLLTSLNPSYKSTTTYKNIEKIFAEMQAAQDPDVLNEKYAELQTAVADMLNSYDGKTLAKGISALMPVEITDSTKEKAIYNSSIGSDYAAGVSRTTSRGKQNESRLEEIQAMAKADLEAAAEAFKTQLKAELGDAYNEAEVTKYINDAMNDTISLFTANITRKNQHGNYNSKVDQIGFAFYDRSGTSKGRYSYNVKSLVDTFVSKFNETSAAKNKAKIDPNLATYDKENVMTDALGNDYYRNTSRTVKGKNNDQASYAKVIEMAKADLNKIAASLRASLIAEGVPLSSLEIDEIIDNCMADTISDMKKAFQYCQPSGSVSGGGIAASIGSSLGAGAGAAITTGVSAVLLTGGGLKAVGTAAGLSFKAFAGLNAGFSFAGPVGWAAAGVTAAALALKSFTNIFGASYGQHNADAGFYFERKSNSKSGKWGYDVGTLGNTFMAKVDAAIAEAKKKQKTEETTKS